MNLAVAFAESVQKQPGKVALYWGDQEYSYSDLWRQSAHVSEQLRQHFGVKPGDRVGLWLKNCPEFIPSLFGILGVGAVVVPINNFLKTDEVNFILKDASIDVLITDAELGTHHRALEHARPHLKLFRIEQLAALNAGNGSPQPEVLPPIPARLPGLRFGRDYLHVRDHGTAQGRHALAQEPASQRRELPYRAPDRIG